EYRWPALSRLAPRTPSLPTISDFGSAGIGAPVWDIAVLTLFRPDKLDAVLAGYRAAPDLCRRTEALLPAYKVLRHLGAITWLVDHGYDPSDHVRALVSLADADAGR